VQVAIEDICIHEAAHAVVYEALEIPLQKVWIEEDSRGLCEGMAERGQSPDDLTPALVVLEFMAGAAALFVLAKLPDDRVIKKTTSDFCISLKYLQRSYSTEPRQILQWLELAARGFVAQWIAIHHDMVIGLASELQKRRVPLGRSELSGIEVHAALTVRWHGRPSRAEVIAFAESGWEHVQRASQPVSESPWHNSVLAAYAEMVRRDGPT
jgi:hypothetical protein